MNKITEELKALATARHAEFTAGLVPTIDPAKILGVKMAELKALAKALIAHGGAASFLARLPHDYLEENILHGLIISAETDWARLEQALAAYLPHLSCWLDTDALQPRLFARDLPRTLAFCRRQIEEGALYPTRFAIVTLMRYFLDEAFTPEILTIVGAIETEEYYLEMAIAWFFATALAKQFPETVRYLESGRLSPQIYRKTLRKATESFRLSPAEKQYLKALEISAR